MVENIFRIDIMSLNNNSNFFNPLNNNSSGGSGAYLPLDGSIPMIGMINMSGNRIINGSPGVAQTDFATVSQLNGGAGSYLPTAGGTMSGNIDMNTSKIINLGAPINPMDAATKAYVDASSGGSGALLINGTNSMSANLNVGNNNIINLLDPTTPQMGATKNYVDTQIGLNTPGVIDYAKYTVSSSLEFWLNQINAFGFVLFFDPDAAVNFSLAANYTMPSFNNVEIDSVVSKGQTGSTVIWQSSSFTLTLPANSGWYIRNIQIRPILLIQSKGTTVFENCQFQSDVTIDGYTNGFLLFLNCTFNSSTQKLVIQNTNTNTTIIFNGTNFSGVTFVNNLASGSTCNVNITNCTGLLYNYGQNVVYNGICFSSTGDSREFVVTPSPYSPSGNKYLWVPSTDFSLTGASGTYLDYTGNWSTPSGGGGGVTTVPNGGTGVTTLATNSVIIGNGISPVTTLAPVANSVLAANGSSIPSFSQNPSVTSINTGTVNSASNLLIKTTVNGSAVSLINNTSGSVAPLQFYGTNNLNWVSLQAGNPTSNTAWTLPAADGTANQVLQTDGGGALSWVTQSGGGGVTYPLSVANGGTGDATLGLNSVLIGNGTSPVTSIAPSSNSVLIGNASSIPSFSNTPSVTSITTGTVNSSGALALITTGTSNDVSLKNATGGNATALRYYGTNGTNYVGFKAGGPTTNTTWTLPIADGTANQILQTDGSTNLSWVTQSGGGGPSLPVSVPNGGTGLSNGGYTVRGVPFLLNAIDNSLSFAAPLANAVLTTGTSSGGIPIFSSSPTILTLNTGNILGPAVADLNIQTNNSTSAITLSCGSNNVSPALQFMNPTKTFYSAFKAGVNTSNVTWTLPLTDGLAGYFLSTNGSGTLAWNTSGGSGIQNYTNISNPSLAFWIGQINAANYIQLYNPGTYTQTADVTFPNFDGITIDATQSESYFGSYVTFSNVSTYNLIMNTGNTNFCVRNINTNSNWVVQGGGTGSFIGFENVTFNFNVTIQNTNLQTNMYFYNCQFTGNGTITFASGISGGVNIYFYGCNLGNTPIVNTDVVGAVVYMINCVGVASGIPSFITVLGTNTIIGSSASMLNNIKFPSTIASQQLLYSSSANTVAGLTSGTTGQYLGIDGSSNIVWQNPSASVGFQNKVNLTNVCNVASTTNISTLNTTSTTVLTYSAVGVIPPIDGYYPFLGSTILLKNQLTTGQNGIYYVSTAGTASVAGVLTRVPYFNSSTNIITGSVVWVQGNQSYSGAAAPGTQSATYFLSTTGTIVVGTTNLVFSTGVGSGSTWTIPSSVTSGSGIIKVTCVGGGAAGNGFTNNTAGPSYISSGAGGGGGTIIKYITGLTSSGTIPYIIGNGTIGSAGNTQTSQGGSTIFGSTSLGTSFYCAAYGGAPPSIAVTTPGTSSSTPIAYAGGMGGSSIDGTLQPGLFSITVGGDGDATIVDFSSGNNVILCSMGAGGNSSIGAGSKGFSFQIVSNVTGVSKVITGQSSRSLGAGGGSSANLSGNTTTNSTAVQGGFAAPGQIIIEY